MSVSLVAVAAILGSLALVRVLHEEDRRAAPPPEPEPAPAQAVGDLDLESIRAAGF